MLKKLILCTILIVSLTALSVYCTPTDSLPQYYTLQKVKALRLAQDAYRMRILDTLVDSLQFRVTVLETEKASIYKSFNDLKKASSETILKQGEIITHETSLKEYYKQQSRKRGKIIAGGAVGAALYVTYRLYRVLKPPN